MASIFKQQYTATDKNGKKVKRKSQYWYIDYKTSDGTRKRVKGFKDKTATQQLAAKLEKEAELDQAGIIDRFKEHRKRPLKEHLEDFCSSLQARGNTPEYCNLTHYRAERICNGCKFLMWNDIQASKVQKFLTELKKAENGISVKTCNYYLKSLKQFCRWMVQDRRADESPLEHLKFDTVKKIIDEEHPRRVFRVRPIETFT